MSVFFSLRIAIFFSAKDRILPDFFLTKIANCFFSWQVCFPDRVPPPTRISDQIKGTDIGDKKNAVIADFQFFKLLFFSYQTPVPYNITQSF